jgi:TatA/E family protein of Tat protein translocase
VQLGPAEILVVLVIALLVFGPTRLPEVGRQVGRAVKEMRKFQHTISRDINEVWSGDDATDASHAAEPPPTLPPKTTEPAELPVTSEIQSTSELQASDAPPPTETDDGEKADGS